MENKKISIDLEHFKLPSGGGGGSRKRHSTGGGDDGSASIRVRPPPKPKDHNRTTKRNALLKFIRRHQDRNYRRMMGEEETTTGGGGGGNNLSNEGGEMNTDLDDTLKFLMNMVDERQEEVDASRLSNPSLRVGGPPPPHPHSHPINHTLKRTPVPPTRSSYENVSTEFPISPPVDGPTVQLQPMHPPRLHPKYGCLKGGELPTYRTYMNHNNHNNHNYPMTTSSSSYLPPQPQPQTSLSNVPRMNYSPPEDNPNPTQFDGGGGGNGHVKLKYVRQKRTNRRTFKIGKSATRPKVGVLISNRTIRKHITTQSHHLKQTSMHEIRQFLVKHGLIKVGTSSPNEVLRKMYESAQMMCGEVYNHNTDTLLHNFIHQS